MVHFSFYLFSLKYLSEDWIKISHKWTYYYMTKVVATFLCGRRSKEDDP